MVTAGALLFFMLAVGCKTPCKTQTMLDAMIITIFVNTLQQTQLPKLTYRGLYLMVHVRLRFCRSAVVN